jgi:hypothetical protein
MTLRLVLVLAGLVIGVVSVIVGSWWTAAAMLLLVVGQGIAERDSRRRARRGEADLGPDEPSR